MPSIWGQSAIIVLWITTTTWIVQREMIESNSANHAYTAMACTRLENNYQRRWTIDYQGATVGGVNTRVEFVNGASRRITNGAIRMSVFVSGLPSTAVLLIRSELRLLPTGELDSMNGYVYFRGIDDKMGMDFVLEGGRLNITAENIPLLSKPLSIPVNTNSASESMIWPIDQIVGLQPGSKWTTRTTDLFKEVSGMLSWLGGITEETRVAHEVTGSESVLLDGAWHDCHVVERRMNQTVAHTLVRKSDGMVLRQDLPVGNYQFVLNAQGKED